MYTFYGSQICKKIKIFWGSAPDPTGKLTALLLSWWEGAAGCPLP